MESIISVLPQTNKRIWYLKTGIMNSILHRNDTHMQKEENLLNQLRERHQFLVVRLPNNEHESYKKISIPVKLNGRLKDIVDEILKYIDNNNIYLLDEEVVIIENAYNEWLELYNKMNTYTHIQPFPTVAEYIHSLEEPVLHNSEETRSINHTT